MAKKTRQQRRSQQFEREKRSTVARTRHVPRAYLFSLAGLVLAFTLLAVYSLGYFLPVQTFADQGHQHLDSLDAKHDPYSTAPPTSGPHVPFQAPAGFYEQALPPEILVHNMEDGGVIVYYRKDVGENVLASLRKLPERHARGAGVVVVPKEDLKAPVVLTAWRRMLVLQRYDERAADLFMRRFLGIDHHPPGGD